MRKDPPRYDRPEDWRKARVWWTAKNKYTGTVHVAVSISRGKLTRCGLRIYPSSKNWRVYEWVRHGNSPIAPTCSQCMKLRKYDLGQIEGNPVHNKGE